MSARLGQFASKMAQRQPLSHLVGCALNYVLQVSHRWLGLGEWSAGRRKLQGIRTIPWAKQVLLPTSHGRYALADMHSLAFYLRHLLETSKRGRIRTAYGKNSSEDTAQKYRRPTGAKKRRLPFLLSRIKRFAITRARFTAATKPS